MVANAPGFSFGALLANAIAIERDAEAVGVDATDAAFGAPFPFTGSTPSIALVERLCSNPIRMPSASPIAASPTKSYTSAARCSPCTSTPHGAEPRVSPTPAGASPAEIDQTHRSPTNASPIAFDHPRRLPPMPPLASNTPSPSHCTPAAVDAGPSQRKSKRTVERQKTRSKQRRESQRQAEKASIASSSRTKPSVCKRHLRAASPLKPLFTLADKRVALTAYVGLRDSKGDQRAYTLNEMVGDGSRFGFRCMEWDGRCAPSLPLLRPRR